MDQGKTIKMMTIALLIVSTILAISTLTNSKRMEKVIQQHVREQSRYLETLDIKVKRYIDLNAQLVDISSLKHLAEIEKYVEEDFFNQQYVHTARFSSMPEEAYKPTVKFRESNIQELNNGYKFICIVDYVYEDGDNFVHTGVAKLDDKGKITSMRLIPHLSMNVQK